MQTIIGAFDDRAQAERAVEALLQRGFSREEVHVERQETVRDTGAMRDKGEREGGIAGFFASLFGDEDSTRYQADTYDEAVRRGSSVVVVDARDEQQAEQAAACLNELGAFDVDERARQWRSEGWTGKEGVLNVVQEDLKVGKRSLDRGGVRVVQRVSEKPVREILRLREERAVVDRRPVDRPAEAGDLENFREGTVAEVREMAEEPVVSKTARVVEEVRVGKQVNEREAVVEDKLRRKDVDVQQLGREGQRERAIASDEKVRPAGSRDPDARTTPDKSQ
jgi:stress response protein YsnF